MKGIIILALLLLTGCANYQSLEQLEAQALASGDWSAVEKRERVIARQLQQDSPQCPGGLATFCDISYGAERCTCLDRNQMRLLFNAY